ncbi:MAG TPA: deaminase [Waddliaceae bacterium]
MKIFDKNQIQKAINLPEVLDAIEKGFVMYSRQQAIIPPVATLQFDHPPGDCHIKYGYAKEGKYYVVKVASGFPDNPSMGIPVGNGLMLLFDKKTGMPVCILLDEGYLTDLRTAAAGAIAAKYLAPKHISCIGIIGTGTQAYYQLRLLESITDSRKVMIWGRDRSKALRFSKNPDLKSFHIEVTEDLDQLTVACNLIVTTTSSSTPLLFAQQIQKGTHITAVGADDFGKQELDVHIFKKADRIIVDSCSQCSIFGDTAFALRTGLITSNQMVELGSIIENPSLGRTSEEQITVADLTGVAIQDLQIAVAAYTALLASQ